MNTMGRPNFFSDGAAVELAEAYRRGASLSYLAKLTGTTGRTVRATLKRCGVEMRGKGGANNHKGRTKDR